LPEEWSTTSTEGEEGECREEGGEVGPEEGRIDWLSGL